MTVSGNEPIDLVDALNSGRLDRREFMRRGALLGLSIPTLAAVLAACGGDEKAGEDTAGTAGEEPAPGSDAPTEPTEPAPAPTAVSNTTVVPAAPGGVIKIAAQLPATPLDPLSMADLGAYGVVAQCFEYLCGLGEGGDIGPGLAASWEPNADSTEWTFTLQPGIAWHDGTPFTSADVVATMERIATDGDGLGGSIVAGDVTAPDDATVVFTLAASNASLPYLVSIYNPQSAITPADWATGTTLDTRQTGTGPFKLDAYDPNTGATFVRNDAYWGGAPTLEGIDWQFFEDLSAQVTAMSGKAVDALVQFSVVGGDALFNDPDFEIITLRTAAHREIWFNCTDAPSQFLDKRVRQAFALSIDRDALVASLFQGKADVGNDHVIAPLYSFFNADAVPQRARDIEAAKALLAEAGFPEGLKSTLHAVDLQEVPQLAELIQIQAAEAGFELEIAVESGSTFYDAWWCQTYPCAGSAELGIVDYGHRATPDVYLLKAFKSGGDWNSSQFKNPDLDAAIAEYQANAELGARTEACGKIQTIMNDEVPAVIPYFYNYITGHSKSVQGVRPTALGQLFLDKASFVS